MLADYETRSRYLSLALDARRVMDLLSEFVRTGERAPDLLLSVREIVASLESMGSAESLLASLQNRLPFSNYEQISALDEVIGPEDRKRLADKLGVLLAGNSDIESQTQSARDTVRILYEIESRALHRFNEPGSVQFTAALAI